ncbi:unnamed protein product [Hydatigera taeniaeformis]|uniref:Non-specific protein-tyrosine kinase n=1 Tax=Hydatigena taeniaeformis TaxID=6205 RepID=A0A158RE78_HYDTA|nr:unnamed protein product [Hydatigera taeniaeformis]
MDVVAGDRILVIEGRAENFWWRGQNRRTGEIASFPREIVRLQRHLQCQDISRPIENSFVHVGHHGFEGRAWGHVDRVDPAFLSGITPHHADTLSYTYARQPLSSASSASASSSQSWRPLGTASSGGARGGGGSGASTAVEEAEDDAAPHVDTYDKASGEGEDEREILDAAPHGTLGLYRLPPPPATSATSKLAKGASESVIFLVDTFVVRIDLNGFDFRESILSDLEASLRNEYCSLGHSSLTASSMPVPIPPPQTSIPTKSRNRATTATSGGGGWSARASSPSSTLSSIPLIDFHQNSEGAAKFPVPSAPIYQPQAPQPCNPYFQAAWNAWMRQSTVSPTAGGTAPHVAEDVDRICRLFDATAVAPPAHQQCEREVLVGGKQNSFSVFKMDKIEGFLAYEAGMNAALQIEEDALPHFYVRAFERESGEQPSSTTNSPAMAKFDEAEVEMVVRRLPGGCSSAEALEALNCAINSPTARDIIHLHSPPPITDVMAPEARDWRVKVALRLLLLRRLVQLQLCTDLEVCWSALEKAEWQYSKSTEEIIIMFNNDIINDVALKGDDLTTAMNAALDLGYRYYDCAHLYANEAEIGNHLSAWIHSGRVLWNTFHRPDLVKVACETSIKRLRVEYLDLYLIHWPVPYQPGEIMVPRDAAGNTLFDEVDLLDTWKAMEDLVTLGLCHHIGVSNFNVKQIERILSNCRIPPAMLQVESNATFPNQPLIDFAHSRGIPVTAYYALGCPYLHFKREVIPLMEQPLILELADKYGKTPAQIALRHGLQRDLCVIFKSRTPARLSENLQVFDFELSKEDMKRLEELGSGTRVLKGAA